MRVSTWHLHGRGLPTASHGDVAVGIPLSGASPSRLTLPPRPFLSSERVALPCAHRAPGPRGDRRTGAGITAGAPSAGQTPRFDVPDQAASQRLRKDARPRRPWRPRAWSPNQRPVGRPTAGTGPGPRRLAGASSAPGARTSCSRGAGCRAARSRARGRSREQGLVATLRCGSSAPPRRRPPPLDCPHRDCPLAFGCFKVNKEYPPPAHLSSEVPDHRNRHRLPTDGRRGSEPRGDRRDQRRCAQHPGVGCLGSLPRDPLPGGSDLGPAPRTLE